MQNEHSSSTTDVALHQTLHPKTCFIDDFIFVTDPCDQYHHLKLGPRHLVPPQNLPIRYLRFVLHDKTSPALIVD
jgi:hypothetical protein